MNKIIFIITNFSEDMVALLISDVSPTKFRWVLRFYTEVSRQGLTFGEKPFRPTRSLSAEFAGTLGILFIGMPGYISRLSSNLFRRDETRPSPRASLENR